MESRFKVPKYIYGVKSGNPHLELYRMKLFEAHKDSVISQIKSGLNMSQKESISMSRKIQQYYSQLIMSVITNRTYNLVFTDEIHLADGMFNIPTPQEMEQFYVDINGIFIRMGISRKYKNDYFKVIEAFKYIIHKLQTWRPTSSPNFLREEIRGSGGALIRITYTIDRYVISIPQVTYNKCVETYKGEPQNLDTAILCCLLRYKTLNSGANQFVVDLQYKEQLRKYGFDFECFGSVFNKYYTHFCSMFYDLEKDFGSCGSFMALKIEQGYYMANPPYDENLLDKMYACVKRGLTSSNSVVILMSIPKWENYELEQRIDNEHLFAVRQIRLEKFHTDMDPSVMVSIPAYINYLFHTKKIEANLSEFLKFYKQIGERIKCGK